MRLLFFFNLITIICTAQPFNLVRYGNAYVIGGATSILPDSDSSFISLADYERDLDGLILRRFNKQGVVLDSNYIDSLNPVSYVASDWYSLEKLSNTRFLISTDMINANAISRTRLLLFDQTLDTLKSRTLAINGYSGTYSWDVLADGNKLIVLSDISDTATTQIKKVNLALTFLDTALNFLDTVIIEDYRPQAGGYYPQQIQRFGNFYYISGRCTYWSQFVESFLIKTDLQGNLIWDKRFAYSDANKPTPYNSANSLMVGFNDTILVTQVYITTRDPNVPYCKLRLLKFDTMGNILSDTVYADEEPYLEISDIIMTKDGNIAFNGLFKSQYNPGDVGIFWKIDRNFNVLFKRAYHYGNENNRSMLYRLHEWPDSTFLNVGTFMYQWQNPDPTKLNYLWLLSLDKNGCLAPGNCGVLAVEEEPFWPQQTSALQVYPNPIAIGSSTDVLNLNLGGLNGQATLSLFTLQGQLLHNQALEFTQGKATFALPPGLPKGTYLVTLKTKTDAYTTKVVVW
jgi:hypothetical protein